MTDPIAACVSDFLQGVENAHCIVNLDIGDEEDELFGHYMVRTYEQMPEYEQLALDLCKGKILDVGAGAGPHSKYLQEQGFDVTSLEYSPDLCRIMKSRGVPKVINSDIKEFKSEKKFDTILLLMNGIGMAKQPDKLGELFKTLSSLLTKDGKIIIESTLIDYMFDEDEDYKEEVVYDVKYKDISIRFPWMFASPESVYKASQEAKLNYIEFYRGEYNFLFFLCF